ncbi:MAG TPA: hypothetical protein VME22_13825 [Solirubrobacteraceae bacterium]|nr:hypothetical protein [Solirubrobacteraceae bacterium]
MSALEPTLQRPVTLPGPGEREIDPRLDDDLDQSRATAGAMLGQPRIKVTGVTQVVTCVTVGPIEVK